MIEPDEWLQQSTMGHCGATTDARGDCSAHGRLGNLGLPNAAFANWSTAVAACLRKCSSCARCNYISVSLTFRDCSWYDHCDDQQLEPRCFQSGPVKAGAGLVKAVRPSLDAVAPSSNVVDSSSHNEPARIAILQASDRAAPLPLAAVVERDPSTGRLRVAPRGAGGKGIRSLTSALNRAYAAMHGHAYVYARVLHGCERRLAAWCQLPAVLGLLRERDPSSSPPSQARFDWVLAMDEDVAFNSRSSFMHWLHLRSDTNLGRLAPLKHRSCVGRCLPPQASRNLHAMVHSTCSAERYAAPRPPCLIVAKEIDGWPGINVGSRFVRNGPESHRLLLEWWSWPLRLPPREAPGYLHEFPGEQNALNDGILANASYASCLHVVPNGELYGSPGRYARHYTGVGADKEAMFLSSHEASSLDILLRLPEWNETMCAPTVRTIRLPALPTRRSAHATHHYPTDVEFTRHCRLSTQSGQALASHKLAALWSS